MEEFARTITNANPAGVKMDSARQDRAPIRAHSSPMEEFARTITNANPAGAKMDSARQDRPQQQDSVTKTSSVQIRILTGAKTTNAFPF
jgi:hypothetical protein